MNRKEYVMSGYSVILDQKNLTVSLDGKVIKLQSPDFKTQTFPLQFIDQLVVYGNQKQSVCLIRI